MSEKKLVCWVVSEGIAGTENQCIGIAETLGLEPVVKRIQLKFPWKQLSPYLCFLTQYSLTKESDPITAPYPDIVIASGRKAVETARYIKRASGGKTFTVFLQDPKVHAKDFDLVVAPQHDSVKGDNVIKTTCALHRVTPEKLEQEKQKFAGTFDHLPKPRVAVLIGGTSKHHTMNRANTEKLLSHLKQMDAGLMITASRRTGEENTRILREELTGDNIYFWDGTGENPYFAFLAEADFILVTEDSVSMTSEALSTGKPVYVIPLEGWARRIGFFHTLLMQQGYTRPFTGELEMWDYTPPNDRSIVAKAIQQKLEEHHG